MKGTRLYYNQFTLIEEISRGGFATIYRAAEENHPAPVAIKVGVISADPGYSQSIRREAEIIQRLDHPGIVRLHPLRREGRTPIAYARAIELPDRPYFFVMEYLAGGTLQEYLRRVQRLPPNETAAVGLEIARALDHMHVRGYAHNDLKLENVVFREPVRAGHPFTPTLIDFGIATRVRLQLNAGSLPYMSPEQLQQINLQQAPETAAELDHTKVDVWGVGVVLYRMLGGRLPFEGRNERTITDRILSSRPTNLIRLSGDVPPEIDTLIIDGCLAKNPAHRLTLLELGHSLRYLVGNGVTASRGGLSGRRGWPFG